MEDIDKNEVLDNGISEDEDLMMREVIHGDAALRLEKCGGEPCAHPAGVFAESCRRGYNRVIFAIFASPCPGSGWKTMISAS